MTIHVRFSNRYGLDRDFGCPRHAALARKHVLGDVVVTEVESDVECDECRSERLEAELPGRVRDLLASGQIVHTRFRTWCRRGVVYLYRRDAQSPTGVMLAESIGSDDFDRIYNELRAAGKVSSSLSPLSPTEGLGGRR